MMRPNQCLGLLLLACAACSDGSTTGNIVVDTTPPTLRGVEPSGLAVDVEAEFEIKFSEPIQRESVFWIDTATSEEHADGIVLGKAEDEDYLVSALASPPISSTQRAKTIAATVTLSEDSKTVILKPDAPLAGLTGYVIVITDEIKDRKFNKIVSDAQAKTNEVIVNRFTTKAPPDASKPQATLKSPAAGSMGVSLGTSQIVVEFTEPLAPSTVRNERIGLLERTTGSSIEATGFAIDGVTVTFDLPDRSGFAAGCEKLCPGGEYALFVMPNVQDLAGNPTDQTNLGTQTFKASTCADTVAPKIAATTLAAAPGDEFATLSWKTDERSQTLVEVVEGNAAALTAACDGAGSEACRKVPGPDAECGADVCALPTDPAQFACGHTARVGSLKVQTAYAWRAVSTDAGGRVTKSAAQTFTTTAPLPKVALNEVFATPQGLGDTDAGKFIELVNTGSIAVDFTPTGSGASRKAWALARCPDAACDPSTLTNKWPLKPATGSPVTLGAGKFAVACGNAFGATAMGVPADTVILKNDGTSTTLVSNGLTSTTAYGFALLSPDGTVVSSYGKHLGNPSATANKGHSFERKNALSPDEAANWAVSTAAVTGAAGNFATPGSKNSVSP